MGSPGDGGDSHVWPWSDTRPVPFPLSGIPMTIKELIGRKCQVVRVGDSVTQEIEPGRITILLNEHGRILNLYLDPDNSDVSSDTKARELSSGGGGGGMDSGG